MDGCRLFHQHSPREVNEGENRSLSLFMSRHAKPGEALRGEKRKEGLGNCMLLELHNSQHSSLPLTKKRGKCPFVCSLSFFGFYYSWITHSSFYNGHAITDIVLFWEPIKGQGLVFLWISTDWRTFLYLDILSGLMNIWQMGEHKPLKPNPGLGPNGTPYIVLRRGWNWRLNKGE